MTCACETDMGVSMTKLKNDAFSNYKYVQNKQNALFPTLPISHSVQAKNRGCRCKSNGKSRGSRCKAKVDSNLPFSASKKNRGCRCRSKGSRSKAHVDVEERARSSGLSCLVSSGLFWSAWFLLVSSGLLFWSGFSWSLLVSLV